MSEENIYRRLFEILTEYNSKFNLTSIDGYEDFLLKHVEDSKLGLPYVEGKVLDVGSGAGFPALVLKIENPQLDMTMLDSVGKKVNYLDHVLKTLGLDNIRAVHARVEDFGPLAAFDTVTARAVAKLRVLAEYALPFIKVGGRAVFYKSSCCDEEIAEADRALKMLGGRIEKIVEAPLTEEIVRKIIIVRKFRPTPKGYPRKGNKPRLAPL